MTKFRYFTYSLDAAKEDCIEDFLTDMETTTKELVTVLPYQKSIKRLTEIAPSKIEMRILLIFKETLPCQE
jgi:hypothetical protein